MKNQVSLSDEELINLYVGGNNSAIETLIYRHKDKVYTCIYNIIKDKSRAEDIFQDVFIKVIDKLKNGGYRHQGKFLHWLMRISYNQCMDNFRAKSPVCSLPDFYDSSSFSLANISYASTEIPVERSQKIDIIRKMIDRLPTDQRDIIIMRHYSDLSFKEIASIVGCNLNTALGRMRYGLLNLRKMVEENDLATVF